MSFNEFIDNGGAHWIASSEFDRACVALFARLESGEPITMAAAAEAVRMPFQAFAETFVEWLRVQAAYERLKTEAAAAVKH